MIKTDKTSSGFEFGIDDRIIGDFRYVTKTACLQKAIIDEDELGIVMSTNELMGLVLGKAQIDKLQKHIADQNDGYVPTEKIMQEFNEILQKSNELKNS